MIGRFWRGYMSVINAANPFRLIPLLFTMLITAPFLIGGFALVLPYWLVFMAIRWAVRRHARRVRVASHARAYAAYAAQCRELGW